MSGSRRAAELVRQLRAASDAFIRLVEGIPGDRWAEVARQGEWAPGKDAEHVAEAAALHLWMVRSALGQIGGRRPVVHRTPPTALLAQAEVAALLRVRAAESSAAIQPLSELELGLDCRGRRVSDFVERVLIGHYVRHQAAIERELMWQE